MNSNPVLNKEKTLKMTLDIDALLEMSPLLTSSISLVFIGGEAKFIGKIQVK